MKCPECGGKDIRSHYISSKCPISENMFQIKHESDLVEDKDFLFCNDCFYLSTQSLNFLINEGEQ